VRYLLLFLLCASRLIHGCRIGMKLAIADVDADRLEGVGKELKAIVGEANVLVIPIDVSKLEEVVSFRDKVYENWGEVRLHPSYHGPPFPAIAPSITLS